MTEPLQMNLIYLALILILFFICRAALLWYYKIDERITQQHETNRLLRKLAGEPPIDSVYLQTARGKNTKTVSSESTAQAPLPGKPLTTLDPPAPYNQ